GTATIRPRTLSLRDALPISWPDIRLEDLLNLQMAAGRTTDLPRVGVEGSKEFDGEGKYERTDDFTARLSAEIIEILPNGNLVLEDRKSTRLNSSHVKISYAV